MRPYLVLPIAAVVLGLVRLPTPALQAASAPATCTASRWAVETLSDADVNAVAFANPLSETVADLVQFPAPSAQISPPRTAVGTSAPNILPVGLPNDNRIAPVETTVYQLTVNQIGAELVDNGDIRVVVADPNTGDTMVAVFPDAGDCGVGTDVTLSGEMQAARQAFVAAEGMPTAGAWMPLSDQAQIAGVGFYDDASPDTTGSALSGIELHPVLSFVSLSSSATTPAPAPASPSPDSTLIGTGPAGLDADGIALHPELPAPLEDNVTPLPSNALMTADGFTLITAPPSPGESAGTGAAPDTGD